jgi:guanine nucleotide-binding protein alpha-1 subunit
MTFQRPGSHTLRMVRDLDETETLRMMELAVDCIIFVAPISAFNQNLAEDETVNRLVCFLAECSNFYENNVPQPSQKDSLSLWKSICANRVLAKVNFILLLNKVDLLEAKLKAGIRFRDYVVSYGDLPNDVKHVGQCQCSLCF